MVLNVYILVLLKLMSIKIFIFYKPEKWSKFYYIWRHQDVFLNLN